MTYALRTNAGIIELNAHEHFTVGSGEDAITYLPPTLSTWSVEALAAIGVLQVVEGAVPDGKVAISWTLTDDGTTITRTPTLVDVPPPAPPPVPDTISDRQFFQALALLGMISTDEALSAVKTGEIPSAMASFIATMPATDQFNAQMLLAGATVFERSNALVPAFMAAQTPPMTSTDIDHLWTFAASL